ncbi:hypothetical protein JB92DRAFT_590276 [Gautieria morchelliformis]|nr:hypothetical protein JB92DRAFT_590276 [Gautieria morchelliformis]
MTQLSIHFALLVKPPISPASWAQPHGACAMVRRGGQATDVARQTPPRGRVTNNFDMERRGFGVPQRGEPPENLDMWGARTR